jgi:hypothetical protein
MNATLGRGDLDLGSAGVSKALKRVESVFRKKPEIKQRIPSAAGNNK